MIINGIQWYLNEYIIVCPFLPSSGQSSSSVRLSVLLSLLRTVVRPIVISPQVAGPFVWPRPPSWIATNGFVQFWGSLFMKCRKSINPPVETSIRVVWMHVILFILMRHAARTPPHTAATRFCSLRFVAADVVWTVAKCRTEFRGERSFLQVFQSSLRVLCGYFAWNLVLDGLTEFVPTENWMQKGSKLHNKSSKMKPWGALGAYGARVGSKKKRRRNHN